MWFDAHAALKKIEGGLAATSATLATHEAERPKNLPDVADVADVATLHPDGKTPDAEAFEERAAIAEFDGGLTRAKAEHLAARAQGFDNIVAFRAAVRIGND